MDYAWQYLAAQQILEQVLQPVLVTREICLKTLREGEVLVAILQCKATDAAAVKVPRPE